MAIASKKIDFKTYLVSYRHEGELWQIEVRAASELDARERLSKLASGQVDGELVATLPVQAGWLAKAIVLFRNYFRA